MHELTTVPSIPLEPPEHIARRPRARVAWGTVVAALDSRGRLSPSDAPLIMVYASAVADYEEIQEAKAAWDRKMPDALRTELAHGQLLLSDKKQPYINKLVAREAELAKIINDTTRALGLAKR